MIKQYLDEMPRRTYPEKTSRLSDVAEFLESGRNVAEICMGDLDPVSVRSAYVYCIKSMRLEQTVAVVMRSKRIFLVRLPLQS